MADGTVQSSPRQLLWTLLASLVAGLAAFVVFVLPAEFDVDPLGTGELMGIKGMAGYSVQALTVEAEPAHTDRVEFPLAPFESVEYKYELAAGQAVVYHWHAEGEVLYDLHGHETGTDEEDSVTFSTGRVPAQAGTYVAPYDGEHGWFWENRGDEEVVVVLETLGYFHASITYSPAGEYRREF